VVCSNEVIALLPRLVRELYCLTTYTRIIIKYSLFIYNICHVLNLTVLTMLYIYIYILIPVGTVDIARSIDNLLTCFKTRIIYTF